MTLEFLRKTSEIYSNIKFHENLSSGIQVVPRRQTNGQTDMLKLILAFHSLLNAPIFELNLLLNGIPYKKFQQNRKLLII
jgi:hypothetical protein